MVITPPGGVDADSGVLSALVADGVRPVGVARDGYQHTAPRFHEQWRRGSAATYAPARGM